MSQANPQQLEIIEGFGRGQAVIAGAGCGKTTTLVAKCIRLLELNPKARFCAVSFTEKSVRDLKQSLAKGFQRAKAEGRLRDFDQHDHWIKTIHGLSYSIIQEFAEAAGLAGGERILLEDEAERLWKRSLDQLWSQTDNAEISASVGRLLGVYSKRSLESLLGRLRNLEAFGAEEWIRRQTSQNLADLWLVFESVRLRYTRYKQRAGALDFNDLELHALRALDHERVRKYYQKRFDLVLVDEFQDTNPVQGKILEKFVRPGFTNLCIVGDPKQSIYRFRDADVTVFQDLTTRLDRKHLLTTNYRSRPGIIDFVNEVCAPLFAASELEYEPLVAGREARDAADANVFKIEVGSEKDLANFLRQEVADGRDLAEYVLLARSVKKDQTLAYLSAFEAAGVPFVFGSGGRFYSDPRVVELVAFLKGWLSGNNSLSQVAALRAPWIGISDEKLVAWKNSGRSYFESFFAENVHPIAKLLSPKFQARVPLRPGEILETLWGLPEMPEEMLLPMATLWQKAEDLSAQGSRYHEIVAQFDQWIAREKIESDIPPPDSAGAVRIMTVHASKGLQFPRVILIDFEKATRPDGKKDLLWNRGLGVHLFERDEDGKKPKEGLSAVNDRWSELERRADVAESKRVFYVALTRAQEALYFVWPTKEKEDYKDREVDLARDYWRAWVEHVGAKSLTAIEPEKGVVHLLESGGGRNPDTSISGAQGNTHLTHRASKKVYDTFRYRPRHSPSEWLILHQCPLRYYDQYSAALQDDETPLREEQLDFTDLERGADFVSMRQTTQSAVAKKGEHVHKLIEEERWDELAKEFRDEETGEEIVARLQEALNAESGQAFKEVGFEVPFSRDEALVGVMDRLVIQENEGGAIQITDYKWTGSPRPPQKLLEHYLLQLQLYAWAALKMLGEGDGDEAKINAKPRPIRARLIHFTQDSMEIVTAPEAAFDPKSLDVLIVEHFELSKKLLFQQTQPPVEMARPGEHCRYCPSQKTCSKVDGFGIV